MKQAGIVKGMLVSVAVAGLCLPQPALAAVSSTQAPRVIDVALGEGGVLRGQVVDCQGVSMANVPVLLLAGEQKLAVSQTDDSGYFSFKGLCGGVYQVSAAEGFAAYRLWVPGTAPPSSQRGALIVAGTDLVRGQLCDDACSWMQFHMSNPYFLAAMVTAAVGTPILIHNLNIPVSPH